MGRLPFELEGRPDKPITANARTKTANTRPLIRLERAYGGKGEPLPRFRVTLEMRKP